MKNAFVLLSALTLACGGVDNGDLFDDAPDGGDLGQIEQAFGAKTTPSFQFGTRTATTKQRCNFNDSQVCAVPPAKSLSYCVHVGTLIGGPDAYSFNAAEQTRVVNIIEGLDAVSDFTLTHTTFGDCTSEFGNGQIKAFKSPVGAAGIVSNDVKDYGVALFSGLVGLTEGAGVQGDYQNWTNCVMSIDVVDILAKGVNASQDNNGLDHAAAHSLVGCLGIGGRTGDGGRASRNLFNPATTAVVVSAGEACSLNSFTVSSPGQYFNDTPNCPTD